MKNQVILEPGFEMKPMITKYCLLIKTKYLLIYLSGFLLVAGCTTGVSEEHDVHVFSGIVVHYTYGHGLLGAKVVLSRGDSWSNGNLGNPVKDSTHSSGIGHYALSFPKDPTKTHYTISAEKDGYVFIRFNNEAKPISQSVTTFRDTLYMDSVSVLRINIFDAPPVNTSDEVIVTTTFSRPNGVSYSTERSFTGSFNTYFLQNFSYSVYPNVTVSWVVINNGAQVGSGSQQVVITEHATTSVTVPH